MKIFSNLAISLDGKIATRKRELFLLGTKHDHQEMQRLRKKADLILIGASTLRGYKKPNLISGQKRQPINAIVSSSLDGISPRWPFFTDPQIRRVLFVGPNTPAHRLRKFEKTSEIVILNRPTKRAPAATQIVTWCNKNGLKSLLVEGGGAVMWDFTSAHLIQEYHVTLTPKIIGGEKAATLVDGEGFLAKAILNLKLKSQKVIGDEIFLVYEKL